MATAEKYHHYKDMWKFDIKTNTWEECKPRGGSAPPARSGHRAVTWRHYMILFGGFHEALRSETRWFNDIHIYDFQTSTWTELKYGKLARVPPARSACNMALCTAPSEALFIVGGYSKVKNASSGPGANRSEGIMHVDCWMLPLKQLIADSKGGPLNGASPPSWERLTRKGEYPSARAGTSSILHKNKLLVFGGVLDNEGDHHKMESVFFDDLFALDMERRRWFAMRLKKQATGGRRRRRKKDDDGAEEEEGEDATNNGESDGESDNEEEENMNAKDTEAKSSGWDLDQLRHDMFAFIDADGNVVYEKIEDDEEETGADNVTDNVKKAANEEKDEKEAPSETNGANNAKESNNVEEVAAAEDTAKKSNVPPPQAKKESQKIATSSVMKVDAKGLPTAVARQTPLPRINCATVVRNNTLYIYGGVLEVGDREVSFYMCVLIISMLHAPWSD